MTDLDSVVIRQRVNAAYEKAPETFKKDLAAAGERTIVVQPGDSPSSIISRQFAVGVSNAPQAYALLERALLTRNEIATKGLPVGSEIRIPDLPRLALSKPNPLKAWNGIPKIAMRLGGGAAMDGGTPVTASPLDVSDVGRPAAQAVSIYRTTSVEDAQQAMAASPDTVSLEMAILQIDFSDGASAGQAQEFSLSPSDEKLVRSKISGPAKQLPVLIILDDSWPDDDAFREARDFFQQSIDTIREKYRVVDDKIDTAIWKQADAPWLRPKPSVLHSAEIKEALEGLQALETSGPRVRVIYVPLFALQKGAAAVFRQIIALDQAIILRNGSFDDPAPSDVLSKSREFAASAVERIGKATDLDIQKTDVALVQSIFAFCQHYGATFRQPCFVNTSWTVPAFRLQPRMPDAYYGTIVAAAGNKGDKSDIYGNNVQFAARSMSPPGDVLAVMNIDAAGAPACESSVFGPDNLDVFGLGFSGQLKNGCGTSFASPRVAWLLAAREAMRLPATDYRKWRNSLWKEVTSSLNPTAAGYDRRRLRLDKFFQ
ncbi:hypothetical protein ASE00_18390 [Sphingomonas sp. Root710]|uniref:hypothetical protein n=1 Tax=Sphingomonas sp. Root710 TaxID=1736594 RepID=UPI0006F87477|nr:hypothetical protein [Sphingomonas sp. Root710]KRB79687.1 hypothetical protein ASE00_18390 [Sphingomonas sp. Root710]